MSVSTFESGFVEVRRLPYMWVVPLYSGADAHAPHHLLLIPGWTGHHNMSPSKPFLTSVTSSAMVAITINPNSIIKIMYTL